MKEKSPSHSGLVQASRARKSTISLLVAYASLPAHHSDIRLVFEEDACKSLAPWFFALDRTHYARWLMAASSYLRYGMS